MLLWKKKEKEIKINNLKELFDVLIGIKQECIDKEFGTNLKRMNVWIESNFPKQLELIAHLQINEKEFTFQQIREQLIRDLRKLKL